MSAIPGLKKKLRGVRATEKLSKAMKTVSAAKYTKLTLQFRYYSEYSRQYRELCNVAEASDSSEKTETLVIFGSNKGFCGAFNNEIVQFFEDNSLKANDYSHLIVYGEKIGEILSEKNISTDKILTYSDVPAFSEIDELYSELLRLSEGKKNYKVKLIYPVYKNTMKQIPTEKLFAVNPGKADAYEEDCLMYPDRETILASLSETYMKSVLYGVLLETALGAQAATMMTMRSSFDMAQEFGEELESEIHRQRQQAVTADVLETSTDMKNRENGAERNG